VSRLSGKDRDELDDDQFAFPEHRKEPIYDAEHVREAIARFDQVTGVSNAERDAAWSRLRAAASKYKVELHEDDWRELFKRNDRTVPRD